MNPQELNISIQETLKLGEKLAFREFSDSEFEKYKNQAGKIAESTLRTSGDEAKIKTCVLILKTTVEDFRYSFWKRFFAPYYVTGTLFRVRNTKEQLRKRYILNINSRLPILIN